MRIIVYACPLLLFTLAFKKPCVVARATSTSLGTKATCTLLLSHRGPSYTLTQNLKSQGSVYKETWQQPQEESSSEVNKQLKGILLLENTTES